MEGASRKRWRAALGAAWVECGARGLLVAIALAIGASFGASCETRSHREARDASNSEAAGSHVDTFTAANDAGEGTTVRLAGLIVDPASGFDRAFGTNGRSCATCHHPGLSMTITPAAATALFNATDGNDPLFRLADSAVSPKADVSTTDARRIAYALLLRRGLVRIGLPVPASADFELTDVKDPYSFASASEVSLYRRPLPTANLRLLSTLMWDGREGVIDPQNPEASLRAGLASQASHATRRHAEVPAGLSDADAAEVVEHELTVFTAQSLDSKAGPLNAAFASGGPFPLATQEFFVGINDPAGGNPTGLPFNSTVFTIYAAWGSIDGKGDDADARRSIARGQKVFNDKRFTVSGVGGLNSAQLPSLTATCSACHNAPGSGTHSAPAFFNLGLTEPSRTPGDLPLYTLREKSTGNETVVSDLGRALISGKFADAGAFKVPSLRGLSSRPPYFHNGWAGTLRDVVAFYDARFEIGLTEVEVADLVTFLGAL